MNRFFAATLLTMGLLLLGFGLGGGLAAEFVVAAGRSGLEGAATVALFALGGAIAGLVAGILLARRLPLPVLVRWTVISMLLGTGIFALFLWRGAQRKRYNRQPEALKRLFLGQPRRHDLTVNNRCASV